MADTKLSTVVGGGGLPKLAPDLTFPSSKISNANYVQITGINAVGSLTTALSLTGKFSVSYLALNSVAAETITVKLTVDGVVIWNDTYANTVTTVNNFIGTLESVSGGAAEQAVQCESSFLLELQTTADTSVNVLYIAREIL